MGYVAAPLADLIRELEKLPTIGPKTAARLAYHLLSASREDAAALAEAIVGVKDRVRFCAKCFSLAEDALCPICSDLRRDSAVLCVVERTSSFRGRYHVLGGLISPMEGIGVGQLKVKELIERIDAEGVKEVIIATNPNAEGESTALYLARMLQPLGVAVTRLAYGLPIGGDLDYADEITLARALEGRRAL